MSITGLSDQDNKLYKKSFHRRNDSGELDVFEAARYFSGYNEAAAGSAAAFTQRVVVKEDNRGGWRSGGRISLDVPAMRTHVLLPHHHNHHNHHNQQSHQTVEKQMIKDKKYKQPSSPGGRLASFLNSLFSQSASKKKKSKSSSMKLEHEEESPGGRRKRRSSISHFRSSSTTDSKSSSIYYSSSSSGFRTPPPYAQTPTKSYRDFRSLSDHKLVGSLSKCNVSSGGNIGQAAVTSTAGLQSHEALDHDKRERELSWLDEKFKFSNGLSDKYKNLSEKFQPEDQKLGGFRKFNEMDDDDDGGDSDSSSDLFELQNYDLGLYSNGLPVYETTNMDSIKRGTPISTAQM